jgi:polyferredoxin
MFLLRVADLEKIMYTAFIVGNLVYFGIGISFAYHFRDNRAFCKYFCPITVFLKPMSYFSIVRVKKAEGDCVRCHKCIAVCPMDVNMLDSSRKRKNATECILCGECIRACPKNVLKM